MNKKLASILLALTLILSSAACSSEVPESDTQSTSGVSHTNDATRDTSNWPKSVNMASGPMGGGFWPVFVKWAEILNKEIPEIAWTAIEGSTYGNMRMLEEGIDAQIGVVHLNSYLKARAGEVEMTEGETFDNVLLGNILNDSYLCPVVRADSSITSFKELGNKRIAPGSIASGPEQNTSDLLGLYGFTYDSIRANGGRIDFVNFAEMVSLIQDNHIDIGVFSGPLINNTMMELESATPIRILEIEPDILDQLLEMNTAISTGIIPGGTYKSVPEDVKVLTNYSPLIYSSVLPDDLVYEITRVLLENSDQLRAEFPSNVNLLTWEDTLGVITEDMCHPAVWRAITEGP